MACIGVQRSEFFKCNFFPNAAFLFSQNLGLEPITFLRAGAPLCWELYRDRDQILAQQGLLLACHTYSTILGKAGKMSWAQHVIPWRLYSKPLAINGNTFAEGPPGDWVLRKASPWLQSSSDFSLKTKSKGMIFPA